MNWFMRKIIGGDTGTRQGAWFAFLVQSGFLGWGVYLLSKGHDMQPLFALLTVTLTVTVPVVIGAHVHHKQLQHRDPSSLRAAGTP